MGSFFPAQRASPPTVSASTRSQTTKYLASLSARARLAQVMTAFPVQLAPTGPVEGREGRLLRATATLVAIASAGLVQRGEAPTEERVALAEVLLKALMVPRRRAGRVRAVPLAEAVGMLVKTDTMAGTVARSPAAVAAETEGMGTPQEAGVTAQVVLALQGEQARLALPSGPTMAPS